MEEKIKVNITQSTYSILLKDMELFEFYKDNGELNKNLFYNTLILNYYEKYLENENKLLKHITTTIKEYTTLQKDDLNLLACDIIDKIQKANFESDQKFSVTASVKPTKMAEKAFDYIEEYLLTNTSISNYFRNLFVSYTALPQDQREKIIFKNQYETILEAINNKKKIFFTTKKGGRGRHESSPYIITNSKEELFNYLLAVYKNRAYTFRLSRILDVTILKEDIVITDEQKSIFEKMIKYGPQYSYGENELEEIVVKLTPRGIEQFKSMYIHRPTPDRIDGDLYYFNCSYTQVLQYFVKLGRNACIISPISLAQNLKEFYFSGYNAYLTNFNKI